MLAASTNGLNAFASIHNAIDELDDVIAEIAQLHSLVGCANVMVRRFDDLEQCDMKIRLENTNCILALIDSMDCKVQNILARSERVLHRFYSIV